MQTLQQESKEGDRTNIAAELARDWRSRLACECSEQSTTNRESIICWLLGEDLERFNGIDASKLALTRQAMEYRYRILRQRYLGQPQAQAYRHLTNRLGSLVLVRNKIRAFLAFSQDRTSTLVDVLQEVIQELLQRDRYLQQEITWIAQCTNNSQLRTALLLAATEEYCLRPIRNQPLLVYRFVNYIRRKQQGGVTQVPDRTLLRLYSDRILTEDGDDTFSVVDTQALAVYQDAQVHEEKQALRQTIKHEFSSYLADKMGSQAVQWLHLYLQGKSPEAIARQLSLSVKEVYRLREKISYHAVRVFGLKHHPELVSNWLETSLLENSFGLMPQQWQQFWSELTPRQRQVIELKKAGKNLEAIASFLNCKISQVTNEWYKLCLTAQALRSQG